MNAILSLIEPLPQYPPWWGQKCLLEFCNRLFVRHFAQSCYDIYRDTSKSAIIVPLLGFFLASVEYRSFVKGRDIGRLRLVIENVKRKKWHAWHVKAYHCIWQCSNNDNEQIIPIVEDYMWKLRTASDIDNDIVDNDMSLLTTASDRCRSCWAGEWSRCRGR